MKQLIDVEFKDLTSYPAQAGGDVGAIIIDHNYGPVGKLNTMSFDEFIAAYPPTRGTKLSNSYVNAYRAYQTGLNYLEVVRLVGADSWQYLNGAFNGSVSQEEPKKATITGELTRSTASNQARGSEGQLVVGLKYPGNPDILYDADNFYFVRITVNTKNPEVEGVTDVRVELIQIPADQCTVNKQFKQGSERIISVTPNSEATTTVVESVTGGWAEGVQINGENYALDILAGSKLKYLEVVCDYTKLWFLSGSEDSQTQEAAEVSTSLLALIPQAEASVNPLSSEILVNAYSKYFKNIETSSATLLIDPGTSKKEEALTLIALADFRQNCCALVGYPTSAAFTKEAILEYGQALKTSMFGAFYALREQVNIAGKKYASNAIGSLAGTYASVAASESVNQLPSAKTWGSFSITMTDNLEFDEVLELQQQGINTCYNSVDGPRLWGLRSLYKRSTSYFSKFNVSRVCARILQYAYNVAMDAIHTGNTDQRKALTQNLLQADLDRLIAQSALRQQSSVQCDAANNRDIDTNGGEILIIDYTCYFVKLIERVKIRITATDSSVSATVSGGQ